MKIKNHITPDLLTYKTLYPYDRYRANFGPRFEHPTLNREGDAFRPRIVDVLRSYDKGDVYNYSAKGKTYVIPSAASIAPVVWPTDLGPAQDARLDVAFEYDSIRDIGNKGSKILAPGLIDNDLKITSYRTTTYKSLGLDPVTGAPIDGSDSNRWVDYEVPTKDRNNLPARSFVVYELKNAFDIYGNPEVRGLLVYTGETPGVQPNDGAIELYGFLPSPEHPLTILAGG